jgi:rod shape-determining protein MreD
MRLTVWQRIDVLARQLTPFGLTLTLAIVALLPIPVPGVSAVTPLLTVMAVYHWSVARPELLPAHAVFLIGLAQDMLSASPVGLNAMVLLAVYGIVVWQHRFLTGKSFGIVWLGYAVVSAGATLLAWLLAALYFGEAMPVVALAIQYLVSLGLYPLLGWALLHWQRAFLAQV